MNKSIFSMPNRIKKSFLFLLLGIYLSMLFPVSGYVSAAPNNNSVTAVVVYYDYTGDDGKPYSNLRTGIPVGTGDKTKYILTDGLTLNAKVSVKADGQNAVSGTMIWQSEAQDFAILQLASEINVKPVTFSPISTTLKNVIKVTAIGYPVVNGQFPQKATATAASLTDIGENNGYVYYKTDTELSPGYTGGPLFNENGYVIGMNFSRPDFKGYGFSIQTEQLLPLLDKQGIKYILQPSSKPQSTTETKPQTTTGTKPQTTSQQKTQTQPQSTPQRSTQATPQSTPKSSTSSDNDALLGLMVLGILAVVILVVIGVITFIIILVIKKNKKSKLSKISQPRIIPQQTFLNSQEQQQFIHPEQSYGQQNEFNSSAQLGTPVLRCISGVFNGNRMELTNEPVLIGKDPRFCQIVYPSSENAVSDQHCVIRYNSSDHSFILEDRGSFQGTFSISGERIIPGVLKVLKSGERFFLGNPQNLFEVVIEQK